MQQPLPSIGPEGLLEGIHWRAVLLGVVVDVVLTGIAAVALLLWAAGPDAFSAEEDVAARAIAGALASPRFLLASLAAGLLATGIGAYAGARRAGVSHVRHGGWIAVASAAFGAALYLLPGAHSQPAPPLWYDVVGIALMLPAGLLGGLLAARRDAATA